ncbi:MAG: hypothetical protein DRI34_02430 [Deltaproteobacteria bacterium]|nr:MAG: hypothetical protein DRI34_02430 [Deltaproteobacteria bacterium]
MRLVLLGILLGLMATILALSGQQPQPLAARSALVLGFLLLSGFLVGELLVPARLPRISGYLLAGMLYGPALLGIIDRPVLDSLSLINELALVLIAYTAGAELEAGNLLGRLRGILAITLVQSLLVFLAVGLAFWLLAGPLGLRPAPGPVLVAFIALVATAKSPATTVAVIVEMRARGPLTDTVLGCTVIKDILVLVGFSLLMTLGLPRAGGEAAGVTAALRVVGLSLGLGLLCGLVMIGLLRLLRGNYLLFVLACALVTVHLAHTLHLNDLLLAVTAGFVVSNFSPSGGVFRRGLEGAGAPVFLVFFCLAGAALDLTRLAAFWPAVLLFVLVRGGAIWAGTWLGAAAAGEGSALRHLAWPGFIGQAGVSLGLAATVRAAAGPAGALVADLVVGAVVVNQVIGPVLFRWALVRSGEAAVAAEQSTRSD